MAKPFDATLKELVDAFPEDWGTLVARSWGISGKIVVKPLDADLSTASPQADKLFRMTEPAPALLHLELQVARDKTLPQRMLVYNVFAEHRHGAPVLSTAMVFRPEAETPNLTGELQKQFGQFAPHLVFHYRVVRVWELPVGHLLAGSLGVVPLALLTDEAADRLPEVVHRAEARFGEDSPKRMALETLTFILSGLRYESALLSQLFREAAKMRESSTYQAILAEGRQEGRQEGQQEGRILALRETVRELGERRFGAPSAGQTARIDSLADLDRLTRIRRRLFDAASWDDLLATE